MKQHNFSAGPSILNEDVLKKASEAVLNFNQSGLSIIEISHRSKAFVQIMEEARALALELAGLQNKGYQALLLQGGASMEFLRVPLNVLKTDGKAAYLDTGTWASNAIKEAENIGNVEIIASSKTANYTFIPKEYSIPEDADYFHCTSNNTIYGTQIKNFPETNVPMVCDMSSDIFSRRLNFEKFGIVYAGAQKNLGPAGVSLVLIKEDLLGKTGRNLPSILDYQKHIEKESMYNTPAVFAVYTTYLTLKWLKEKGGIAAIEKINDKKAALLYDELDRNECFITTAERSDRSLMNVTFLLKDEERSSDFENLCSEKGISGIKGHRSVGGYRASIYNAMPVESVQHLVQTLQEFENKHNK